MRKLNQRPTSRLIAKEQTAQSQDEEASEFDSALGELIEIDVTDYPELEQTEFDRQLDEYHALYERGEIEETHYTSAALHELAGRFSVIRELQRAYGAMIVRYMNPKSANEQKLSLQDAIKKAEAWLADTTASKLFNELKFRSVEELSWEDFDRLFRLEPKAAEALWARIKTEAREDFESGSMAAQMFETTEWRRNPWRRAQFVGIRDGFIDDYKPRGAVELSMIDLAVTALFLYYYWTDILMQRSDTRVMPDLLNRREREEMEKYEGRYDWIPPRVSEQDAIEHAAQMADRFRRQYLSAIRSLRDYRRWGASVIINNPEQVNIAEDGGQQVNVKGKTSRKKKPKKLPQSFSG